MRRRSVARSRSSRAPRFMAMEPRSVAALTLPPMPSSTATASISALARGSSKALAATSARSPTQKEKEDEHESSFSWSWFSTVLKLLRTFVAFALGLLLVIFMPERIIRVREYLAGQPWSSGFAGVAVLLGFVPMCILLAVTIVGI